jgi:hypothetical protein
VGNIGDLGNLAVEDHPKPLMENRRFPREFWGRREFLTFFQIPVSQRGLGCVLVRKASVFIVLTSASNSPRFRIRDMKLHGLLTNQTPLR